MLENVWFNKRSKNFKLYTKYAYSHGLRGINPKTKENSSQVDKNPAPGYGCLSALLNPL